MSMNKLLQLKGHFNTKGASRPGPPTLPANGIVKADHVNKLKKQLEDVRTFWRQERVPFNPLVSVHYRTVVAKSNRIRRLLSWHSNSASKFIVGAKFEPDELNQPRHVITYCVSMETLSNTIRELEECATILERRCGSINSKELAEITTQGLTREDAAAGLRKTAFAQLIRDAYYANEFQIPSQSFQPDGQTLVTLYDVHQDTVALLRYFGVTVSAANAPG